MLRGLSVLLLLTAGCGEAFEEVIPEACEGLRLSILDDVAQPPANVASLVRVSDCADQPLGVALPEEAFELAEDGRPLSKYEATRLIQPAERQLEGRLLIALDLSGSITRAGLRPLMIEAARTIVDTTEDEVAIYGFDGRPDLIPFAYFTRDRAVLKAALDTAANVDLVDDSTNLNGTILNGLEVLDQAIRIEEQDRRAVAQGGLIIFTDGTDHAGWVDQDRVTAVLDSTRHAVFAVGIGPTIDDAGLAAVGRSGYALASEPEALDATLEALDRQLAARASADYLISYCSPARSGYRTLEIRATHAELTGRVFIPFDATGFGAGCTPEASPLR